MDMRIYVEKRGLQRDMLAGAPDGERPGRMHNRPTATTMPLSVPAIAVAGYGGILLAFWLTFAADGGAIFAIAIGTLYGIIYFGVPYLMNRMAAKYGTSNDPQSSLSDFLNGDLDTIAGRISGWSALVQVTLVPIALAFGTLAIGFIYIWLR